MLQNMANVLVLHPGAMGASVAAALIDAGHEVAWVVDGRSTATVQRAKVAGCRSFENLAAALVEVAGVVSVVPPEHALAVANLVAESDFGGWCLDANAISPSTAAEMAELFAGTRTSFVDGGIVGPPANVAGTTRLALSGPYAAEVADVFAGCRLEPVVVGEQVGAASAFKVGFAAWTKGSSALLLAVRTYAVASGVDEALASEWDRRGMDVVTRTTATIAGTTPKAWRFAGEMAEIAKAWTAAGVPEGFFTAAEEVYSRLATFKDADYSMIEPPDVRDIAAHILGDAP
ncbi:MAG: 3-hydroxyisobutyrate dehydrogenase-like beta-hydroxyacid dehydrogenase [Candidatus Poriferisodalaceae bacterium]|jgi:3-hydroxyisobutyrate dehydrogenase-like beta-hydroxyacid dehydrogenase